MSEEPLCCCSGVTGLGDCHRNLKKRVRRQVRASAFLLLRAWESSRAATALAPVLLTWLGELRESCPAPAGAANSSGGVGPQTQPPKGAWQHPQNAEIKLWAGGFGTAQNGARRICQRFPCLPGGSGAQPRGDDGTLRGSSSSPKLSGGVTEQLLGLVGRSQECPPKKSHSLGNRNRGKMEWERAASKVPAPGKDKTKSVFKLHACLNFALLLCHYFEKPKLCS